MLLVSKETTERVLADRRHALLRALADRSGECETVAEACRAAIAVLDASEDVSAACIRGADGQPIAGSPPAEPYVSRSGRGSPRRCAQRRARLRRRLRATSCATSPRRSSTASPRARVREEQRRQARASEDLDAAKTAFFSNASHELRTPLSLVLGSLEQASEDSGQIAADARAARRRAPQRAADAQAGQRAAGLLEPRGGRAHSHLHGHRPRPAHGESGGDVRLCRRAGRARAGQRLPAARRAGLRRPPGVGEDRRQPALQRAQVHAGRPHHRDARRWRASTPR